VGSLSDASPERALPQKQNDITNCMKQMGTRALCHNTLAGPSRDRIGSELRRRLAIGALALALYLLQLNRSLAEDHFDYRFEAYREEAGRIGVDTSSWLFEKKITPWLSLQGEAVYDIISGATPIGAPPPVDIKALFPQAGPISNSV